MARTRHNLGGIKTQKRVKLGHELLAMLSHQIEFAAKSTDGRTGYLLPEPEFTLLELFVVWAVETGPQLRGGRELSKEESQEEMLRTFRLLCEVREEQKKSKCSKTDAIKAVAKKRRKQSWQALEKEISPTRLRALIKKSFEMPAEAWPTKFWASLDREHWGEEPPGFRAGLRKK